MYSALDGSCQTAITPLRLTVFSIALKSLFPYSLFSSFPGWCGKIWTFFPPACSFINTVTLSYRQAAQYTWKCALKVTGDTRRREIKPTTTFTLAAASLVLPCPALFQASTPETSQWSQRNNDMVGTFHWEKGKSTTCSRPISEGSTTG